MVPRLQGRKRLCAFQSTRGPGHEHGDGASRGSEVPGEARQEGWMTRSTEAKVRGSDSTPSGRKKPLGVFSRRNDII